MHRLSGFAAISWQEGRSIYVPYYTSSRCEASDWTFFEAFSRPFACRVLWPGWFQLEHFNYSILFFTNSHVKLLLQGFQAVVV